MSLVSVVTGAAGGMGREIARSLVKRGPLLLVDLNQQTLRQTAEDIEQRGGRVEIECCDLSDLSSHARIVEAINALGRLGAVVHTAGLEASSASFDEVSPEAIVRTNLVATAALVRALRPLANEQTAAVLIASGAGHMFRERHGRSLDEVVEDPLSQGFWQVIEDRLPGWRSEAYGLSKYGVHVQAELHAPSWGEVGARIVTISPGITQTPMMQKAVERHPEVIKQLIANTPLGRAGDPTGVANLARFLTSEKAGFITGCDFLIDGGRTNQVLRDLNSVREPLPTSKAV